MYSAAHMTHTWYTRVEVGPVGTGQSPSPTLAQCECKYWILGAEWFDISLPLITIYGRLTG